MYAILYITDQKNIVKQFDGSNKKKKRYIIWMMQCRFSCNTKNQEETGYKSDVFNKLKSSVAWIRNCNYFW